jgi:hypothetical protein
VKKDLYVVHMTQISFSHTSVSGSTVTYSSTDIHSLISVHRLGADIDRRMNMYYARGPLIVTGLHPDSFFCYHKQASTPFTVYMLTLSQCILHSDQL